MTRQTYQTPQLNLPPINNVTELAPSLDDSVIALHREATCSRCGLVPDDLYEDTALGCTCAERGCV